MISIGASPDHGFDEPISLMADCHRRIEMFIGVLLRVATVLEGAPLEGDAAAALRRALAYFAEAAPRHTADEEESLFPRMRAAQGGRIDAIDRLESDHAEAERLLTIVTRGFDEWILRGVLPDHSRASLLDSIRLLRDHFARHIREEEEEVFPLGRRLLSEEAIRSIGREMRARRRH